MKETDGSRQRIPRYFCFGFWLCAGAAHGGRLGEKLSQVFPVRRLAEAGQFGQVRFQIAVRLQFVGLGCLNQRVDNGADSTPCGVSQNS